MQRRLLSRHAPTDLVAFGRAGARNAADLARDVARLAAELPSGPAGREVLLVIRRDRYALAVAILAAWARSYVPVLPPELDRDAITELAQGADTICVLHDTASGIPLQIATFLAAGDDTETGFDLAAALAGRPCEARSYARTRGVLTPRPWGGDWLEQAQALAARLSLTRGERCASSVGSEHAHGVVLGVLVPLLSGAAFLRETLPPHALPGALASAGVEALVTVPAHVPALIDAAADVAAELKRVVSALGELPPELAERGRKVLGGVWSDLAAQAPEIPILRCSDQERSSGQGATAEREAQIERILRADADVRDVATVTVPDGSRVCVAVVRGGFGSSSSFPSDAAALLRSMRTERIELLEVNRIRRDGIGRAQRSEIMRQFGLRPDGSAVNFALRWGETIRQELSGRVEQITRVEVPSDYGYFDGHFAGYPILPGAAQLSELILPCVRRAWPGLGALTQMARLKFTGRIQPGETIDVVLSTHTGSTSVDFALRRAQVLCSTGSLSFTPAMSEAAS